MKNFNLIEMAKAMKEHKLRHMWRYAAMITLLLTLACGQVWGMDYAVVADWRASTGIGNISAAIGSTGDNVAFSPITKGNALSSVAVTNSGNTTNAIYINNNYTSNGGGDFIDIRVPAGYRIKSIDSIYCTSGSSYTSPKSNVVYMCYAASQLLALNAKSTSPGTEIGYTIPAVSTAGKCYGGAGFTPSFAGSTKPADSLRCVRLYRKSSSGTAYHIARLKVTVATVASSCSAETGLAYGETTVNKTYGDGSFTNTLTNSNSLSVTYSSSNTDVATVNESTGAVTIAGAGTTTITATWAGNASYCEDEVTYTLNVKPSAVVTATETNGWRYTIGEKIDLTCTATGGSSYTYQWQKYTGPDTWTNLSNGTDGGTFSGVTTNRLQISGCTSSNGGSYRCVVTANDQTKESNAYVVYIFTLNGNYDDDSWTENAIEWTGANTGRAKINLAASRTYKFKVTNNDGKWFGCNTGVTIDMSNWTFRTNEDDCVLTTGGYGGGAYTFDIDISYAGDNNISVSVTYPKKTTYLQLCSDWKAASAKYAIYYWKSSYNGWTDFMTAFACDGDVLSADVPVWATDAFFVRFDPAKESTGDYAYEWNRSGDNESTLPTDGKDYYQSLSVGGNGKYYGSWTTFSPTTYTITFAGNGSTSGEMSSISSIACDADQQITANAFEKTGYTFANWTANVDVKVGGATVSAGSAIANSATIQNIRGNIALTAQWTAKQCTVTFDKESGSGGSNNATATYDAAMPDITPPTRAGYDFAGYWDGDNGTGTQYYKATGKSERNWDKNTTSNTTLYAKWTAHVYTVTLDLEGGSGTTSVTATYNATLSSDALFAAPTFSGYTFGGFYTEEAGGGSELINSTCKWNKSKTGYINGDKKWTYSGADNITLKAKWTQTVTLDDNGGSADGSVSMTYKGTAGTPSVPTYAGHTVDLGYYAESSCTNKVMALDGTLQTSVTDGSSVVWTNSSSKWAHAGASTLYAHWKCNTPEISFASATNTVTITIPNGTKVYYTTDGSTPDDEDTEYTEAFTIDADCTVKAIAIQSGCTDSEVASEDCTYSGGGGDCVYSEVAKVTLTGKDSAPTCTGSYNPSGAVNGLQDGNATGYYKLGGKPSYVKLQLGGGNTFQAGDSIILEIRAGDLDPATGTGEQTSTPVRLFTNEGTTAFYTSSALTANTLHTVRIKVTADMISAGLSNTIYIYRTTNEASPRYSQNHQVKSIAVKHCTPSCTTPDAPTSPTNGATTSNSQAVSWTDASNEKWDVIVSESSSTPDAGDTPTASDLTSKSYTFTGLTASTEYHWWVRSVCDASHKSAWVAGSSFTTSAAPTLYTVTFNSNGGSAVSPIEQASEGASITLPTPTKSGYTFQGWYTSGGTKAGDGGDSYNPGADITLYAQWRESCAGGGGNKTLVDINFKDASWSGKTFSQANDNNEDLINGVYFWSKNASNHFSLADNTSKGLTFPNNNMSSGNTYFCIPITGINSSSKQITVTLKHGYSSNKASYKYVYVDGRTTFVDGNTNGSGGEAVSDAANADTEITFTKSSLSNTSGHLIIGRNSSSYTQIYGVTVTTPNNATCYYVTYNGNGATGGFMTDETAHGSGDNVAILENTYTRTGYTFTGWKTEPSGGTSYEPEGTITGISSDITLYAQWSAGTLYSVTYNGNGATSGSVPVDPSSPYASGANVTVLGNTGTLALANYTFDGWATANDGTGTSYTASGTISSIAADVELFAKWKQTVTLNTGSQGSGEDKTPYIYINGAALNGFSAHSAAGYTLNGYYTAPTGGTKVLNADGSFAAAAVTNYITGSKWSRTDATTLYAQWRAAAGSTCYEWDATETKPQTGTNVNFGGLYLTAPNKTKVSFYSGQAADSCYDISSKAKTLYGNLNGLEIASVKFAASSSADTDNKNKVIIAFCSTTAFDTAKIIKVGGYHCTVYTVNKNDAAKTEFTVSAPAGTKSFAISRNLDEALSYSAAHSNKESRYLYYLYVCSAGGGTHTITYANGGGSGSMSSNTSIADDDSQTLTTNSFTAPTNYSFAGWVADVAVTIGGDVKAAGTLIANGATITNITTDIALTAKWTQTITLDANTTNNGSGDNTSATAMYNATSLASITHTTPASGYKLTGYYTAATGGTKVLNSDGTFAGDDITGWISDGKWICVASTRTLYAQYEAAGALIWNLGVNTDATSLTTSSKTSAFTQIAVANMSNATTEGVTYSKSKKTNLTGLISTPATEQSGQYVYVTFVVADGYKFTPSSVKVKAQPVTSAKSVKLVLEDENSHSINFTTASTISGGSTQTVEMTNGSSVYFEDTVTLKIYCYGATDAYRLGTPIQIDGEVEELCATMPSFTQMNYTTTTFAPSADASGSPITIVGGENIDTYHWKYNTTNDRTNGTDCGSNDASLTPLTDAGAAIDGTRYYWCEMENTSCGITIKSPAVAITVASAKSDATVSWTGTAASANYGGGGYTVTATVSTAEWDGTLTEDMLTAMDGVVLSNINVTNDGKTITADFGVTEGANAEATNVEFYLNHPATTDYNAIDATYNTTTLVTSCIDGGGGDGSSYDVRVRKNTTTISQGKSTVYGWDTPTKGFVTQNTGGSVTSTKSDYDDEPVFDSISKGNAKAYWVKSYVANVKKIRVYGQVGDDDLTATGVYHVGSFVAGGSSTAVAYSVVYEDEVDALKKGNHWFEITLDEAISTNDIIYFTVNKNFKIMGVRLTTVGAGGATLAPALSAWSPAIDTRKEVYEDAASFIETVTKTGANANTMGAITYSSGDETIATVDNRTGRVTIANNITWGGDTHKDVTITASLAPSGCYQGKTATYTLRVNKLTCTEEAGTITASSEGSHVVIEGDEVKKCTSETVTLTLGGYEEGATSFQWYKDGVLQGDKTTASITTADAGVWYAVSNKGCAVTSTNEITITDRSTSAHVTRLVKEWYIKNGRLTPDIALWELGDDCSFVGVTASSGWDAGTDLTEAELGEKVFYEKDGIVYLKGTEPKANAGAVQNYTLTLTVNDGCRDQTLDDEGKEITIHHQQNTDKHVLAFVVRGTEKGGWTDGVTADQTTNVGLYNAIAENFDVIATNSWSTDDEQKLKEYYSQFDILCITDYPDTKKDKGANKKSTVDALGALVDIRPILTMEAWVSGLANWRAKGISGSPKSPTTRQYTMDLQCKDHEIFARTELTKVGEGDEAMYRVSMVDNTKEDYATLDATYGGGAHAEKSGYEYGSKPALQGFTFTQEMSDNDLLPIGLIKDGAGNNLQVGIERQHNMEARLMVLGINSYAMERLTDDGERVVINALNYLMKKNAEDIADCSTSFVGGAEGEEKNWDNKDNWTGNTVPLPSQKVRILADCEVSSTVHALDVLIVTDGKYNHGSDNAAGKLTIKENGALIVGGKIQAASAPAYNRPRATTPDRLLIETSSTNQAALIFDNEEGETQATVNYHSKGYNDGDYYQFQYFAIPMDYVAINPVFADEANGVQIYTYAWDEPSNDWERRGYYSGFSAFEGLAITTTSVREMDYALTGNLASTAEREITLTHGGGGDNMIGNSWMAPINIASLVDAFAEDENVEKTVYIYCAGNDTVSGGDGVDINETEEEIAGQWLSIPMGLTTFPDWGGLKVIPAMQAYLIKATGETTLTLNYDEMVRSTAETALNEKLRAPKRRTVHNEDKTLTRLRVADSRTHTDLYFVEGNVFSDAFDNGWEATYMPNEGASPQFYAMGVKGKMAVLATDDFEGTVVGFEPGKETAYTISFSGAGNGYYLNDVKTQASTLIIDGEVYSFEYEAGDDANRFYISRTPLGAPAITTGINNPDAAAPKVLKVIYNDKLYIIRGGKVYSADGQVVK